MFADIAPRYDLLNHLLSLNVDRAWRRAAVRLAAMQPRDTVLDVCAGTGDLSFEASKQVQPDLGGRVLGTDFCPEMVRLADAKGAVLAADSKPIFSVADTLRLPFAAESFNVATVGFGIRNVEGLVAGLTELYRILKPEGRLVILEFTTPRSRIVQSFYGLYFTQVLPRVGRWLSGVSRPELDDAYQYLPDSVSRFPRPQPLVECLETIGFEDVHFKTLTFGIACVHVGKKPSRRQSSDISQAVP